MDTTCDPPPTVTVTVTTTAAPTCPVVVRPAAVCVRDARITYPFSKTPVLNGLNMVVAEGTIYGLLGASGCGKTTLLTCIVGRRRLDEGGVRVLGLTPGEPGSCLPGPTIGYMPQELALHCLFTVSETFRYFGWIAGMTKEDIKRRTSELLALLDIPYPSKLVGELSGGQQRRVSLGVALLAKPPILILDEPTVGVDPTLRKSIWNLLLNETQTGRTTVIITTHYIEEARQSHKVGLMRDGTLLDEDGPARLLSRYGCDTMEDVFLKLSVRQHQQHHQQSQQKAKVETHAIPMVTTGNEVLSAVSEAPAAASAGPEQLAVTEKIVDDPSLLKSKPIVRNGYSNVAPCTWKMFVFTRRNKSVFLVCGMLPVIICILFGYAVGGEPNNLHVAVVNNDYQDCDGTLPGFPADCDASDPQGLSCRYLRTLSKTMFVLDDYGSVESALRAVRGGRAWAAIHFPSNYSHSLVTRHREGKNTPDSVLVNGEISVWMDMSNQHVSDMARLQLAESALQYHQDVQVGCKGNPYMKALPMQFHTPIYGGKRLHFPDFFAPAVILSVVYNVCGIYTMSGFLDDKKDGFMERSVVSGVNVLEVLGAHVLVDAVMMVVVTIITLTFMCSFLQFENRGSLWVLIFLCILHGFGGMFQGYFIASIFTNEFGAMFCATGIYLPTLVLSGLMWPLEGMHPSLRNNVWLLPLNLATTAIRSIMNRGWGMDRVDVIRGFLSASIWLAFFIVITVVTLRYKKTLW